MRQPVVVGGWHGPVEGVEILLDARKGSGKKILASFHPFNALLELCSPFLLN